MGSRAPHTDARPDQWLTVIESVARSTPLNAGATTPGTRAGRQNSRPAQWVMVIDAVSQQTPSCMTHAQWLDYLSAVSAECICNSTAASLIVRAGYVKPCDVCTASFCAAAKQRGMCDPTQFKKRAAMEPIKKEPGVANG